MGEGPRDGGGLQGRQDGGDGQGAARAAPLTPHTRRAAPSSKGRTRRDFVEVRSPEDLQTVDSHVRPTVSSREAGSRRARRAPRGPPETGSSSPARETIRGARPSRDPPRGSPLATG